MNIKKALVVDDSKFAHMTLRKLLVERGIEVDWVGSGEDCMKYLETKRPEIIFMDVMMPGMDGFETSRAITAQGALPIVMCSANATEEDKRDAQQSGAVGFLSKPYTPQQLEDVLRSVSAEWTPPEQSAVPESAPAPEFKWEAATPAPTPAAPREVPKAPPPPPPVAPAPIIAPTTAAPTAPAAVHSGLSVQEIEQIAERAAWASAEKLARDIVMELVPNLATETARNVAQELGQRSAQAAVRAAQEAAKAIATEIARAATERTARDIAEAAPQQGAPNVDGLRAELEKQIRATREVLIKQLDEQINTFQQNALNTLTSSPEFKPQILQLVRAGMQPVMETIAREAAERVVQQSAEQMKQGGGSSTLALVLGILGLLGSITAIVGHIFKLF